jgi:prolyl-tRNA synthetase
MGSYGIGVERALAAVVECHHDDSGIVWPVDVAPFAVAIVPIGKAGDNSDEAAVQLHDRLTQAGVEVLLDDRQERAGVKFRDMELIGVPFQVTVGGRGLANGVVELTVRDGGHKSEVLVEDAAKTIIDMVRAAQERPSQA